jgi:hypothetical protein
MKKLFYPLLFACLLAAPGCSSKKDDPAATPVTQPPATAANAVVKNNGTTIQASVGILDYDDVTDAGGTKVSRAIIYVAFPVSGQSVQASAKYYLTSTNPVGTVTRVVAQPYNSADYNKTATGTLTGRIVSSGVGGKVYLSGGFAADLGPGYTNVTVTFTDLTQ